MISFVFGLSLALNLFLVWYIYKFIVRYSDLVSIIEDVKFKISFFSRHIKEVHELEMFYGEPTIQNLIEHSNLLLSSFEKFNEDYSTFNGDIIENELQEKTED